MRPPYTPQRVLDEDVAHRMNGMMGAVVLRGTGTGARIGDRDIAGKPARNRIGATPGLSATAATSRKGVWVGHDDFTSMGRTTGGTLPAQIGLTRCASHQGVENHPLPGIEQPAYTPAQVEMASFFDDLANAFGDNDGGNGTATVSRSRRHLQLDVGAAHVGDLALTLGQAPLFDRAELCCKLGERAAFVGANGAGKSTLMRMMAGLAAPWTAARLFINPAPPSRSRPRKPVSKLFRHAARLCAITVRRAARQRRHSACVRGRRGARNNWPRSRTAPQGFRRRSAARFLWSACARRGRRHPAARRTHQPSLTSPPSKSLNGRSPASAAPALSSATIGAFPRTRFDRNALATPAAALELNRGYAAFEEWADQIEEEDARNLARLETQLKAEEHWLRRGVTARRSRNEGAAQTARHARPKRRHQGPQRLANGRHQRRPRQ